MNSDTCMFSIKQTALNVKPRKRYMFAKSFEDYILPADHFVTVVLLSQYAQTGFNYSTTQPKYKVKSGLY